MQALIRPKNQSEFFKEIWLYYWMQTDDRGEDWKKSQNMYEDQCTTHFLLSSLIENKLLEDDSKDYAFLTYDHNTIVEASKQVVDNQLVETWMQ